MHHFFGYDKSNKCRKNVYKKCQPQKIPTVQISCTNPSTKNKAIFKKTKLKTTKDKTIFHATKIIESTESFDFQSSITTVESVKAETTKPRQKSFLTTKLKLKPDKTTDILDTKTVSTSTTTFVRTTTAPASTNLMKITTVPSTTTVVTRITATATTTMVTSTTLPATYNMLTITATAINEPKATTNVIKTTYEGTTPYSDATITNTAEIDNLATINIAKKRLILTGPSGQTYDTSIVDEEVGIIILNIVIFDLVISVQYLFNIKLIELYIEFLEIRYFIEISLKLKNFKFI